MKEITGTTKLLGIIGDPIEHSLSPLMHNAALAHLQLDYTYVPFPVAGEDLQKALDGMKAFGVVGFNATIPHKQAVMPLLSHVTPAAQEIGAVNTVWLTNDGWHGTNTDVTGFIAPLKNIDWQWHQVKPVVLGNGGASRAVVAGLFDLGCREIHLAGRNKDKLARFWQSWSGSAIANSLKIHYWENLSSLIPSADLIVNTTPIGMHPKVNASPIDAALMEKIKKDVVAYDLIYTPSPTQFLSLAKDKGAIVIDGLEMLVQQGAAGFEIWTNQTAPVEIMRNVLQNKLYGKNN